MINDINPDKNAPERLLSNLCEVFYRHAGVACVAAFGSLADNQWDQYSDVDLLVVSKTRLIDAQVLYAYLMENKPVLCRGPYGRAMKTAGSCILGIVFENESVFQKLDLNCMTVDEYANPDNLSRFGILKEIYCGDAIPAADPSLDRLPTSGDFDLTTDEDELNGKMFFLSEALKRYARVRGSMDEIRRFSDDLRTTMEAKRPSARPLVGNMAALADRYLEVAVQYERRQAPRLSANVRRVPPKTYD